MDEAARSVSNILRKLAQEAKVGVTGKYLNQLCEEFIREEGAESYNKGYHPEWAKIPFPTALCVCPNGVIVHGIPNEYEFQEGDIVTLDLGIKKNGVCADAALTVPIGKVENNIERLLYYSRLAVYEYLEQLKPGVSTRNLAHHIQYWVLNRGFNIVRSGAGHCIGVEMHMKPNLYNTEEEVHEYGILKEGMVVCIEPILTKSHDTIGAILPDGWSRVTQDRKPTAMFEHMARITKDGYELLTTHFDKEHNFL